MTNIRGEKGRGRERIGKGVEGKRGDGKGNKCSQPYRFHF